MDIADRVKQNATATSDAAYTLGGAALAGFRTFEAGFHAAGVPSGIYSVDNVPILVEHGSDWQIITATYNRSGGGANTISGGVVRESSTGSPLGLSGSAPVVLSVVPSFWNHQLLAVGMFTPTDDAQRYDRRPRIMNGGALAAGQRSAATTKHAVSVGFNTYSIVPYAVAMGCGLWPAAGDGAAMRIGFIWQAHTTDATPTAMACYDADGLIANSDAVACDSGLFVVTGQVTAIDMDTFDCKVWNVTFVIRTPADYSTTEIVGTPTYTEVHEDTATTGWSVAATANAGSNTFGFEVTGQAAKTISWLFTGDLHTHMAYA